MKVLMDPFKIKLTPTTIRREPMSNPNDEKKERRQLRKIKFPSLNNTKFKITRVDLLKEDPSLMRGLSKSGVWKRRKKKR